MSNAPFSPQPGSTPPPGFVSAPSDSAAPQGQRAVQPDASASASAAAQLLVFALGGVLGLFYLRQSGSSPRSFVEFLLSSIAAGAGLIASVAVLSTVFHTGDPDTSSVVSFLVIAVSVGCAVAGWRGSKRLLRGA